MKQKLKFSFPMKQKQKFSIPRTTEGTIFEIATVVLTVIVWVVIVLALRKAPDVVATHFDAFGRPDDYGSKLTMLFPCIVISVMGLCMLAGAYFPHTVNLPVGIGNMRQALLVSRMMRIMAVIFEFLTLAIAFGSLHQPPTVVPVLVLVGLLIAVLIVFVILIRKAR